MAEKEEKITEKQVKEWIERAVKKFENLSSGKKKVVKKHSSSCGGVWFFGFIGALFYYLQPAVTFGEVILGILKSIVWPAFLVYHLLSFLKI